MPSQPPKGYVFGRDAIHSLVKETEYTQSHISNFMRENPKRFEAKQTDTGRWLITPRGVRRLKRALVSESGLRCKKGETKE